MLKKSVLSIVLGVSLIQTSAQARVGSNFEEPKTKLETDYSLLLNPLACFAYGGCAAVIMQVTGVNNVMEFVGHKKAQKQLAKSISDAEFFRDHVVSTEPGDISNALYKNVVIRLSKGEQLTTLALVSNGSTSTYQDVPLEVNSQEITVDNYNAGALKINGRLLISDDLLKAHMATQNLIFDDVIKVPEESKVNGNSYRAATNALLLNQLMLREVHTKK